MNAGIMQKEIYILDLILIVLVGLLDANTFNIGEKASGVFSVKNASMFDENFSTGILNSQSWQITREGDLRRI
jgi:hypothetical protein